MSAEHSTVHLLVELSIYGIRGGWRIGQIKNAMPVANNSNGGTRQRKGTMTSTDNVLGEEVI